MLVLPAPVAPTEEPAVEAVAEEATPEATDAE